MPQPKPFRAPLAYENKKFLDAPEGRILRILSEYAEPLARFRREGIQDTVVFFGSARFASLSHAENQLQILEKPASAAPAPPREQPANSAAVAKTGAPDDLRLKRARAAVKMARYYEDARRIAHLLTDWSSHLHSKRQRFVVTTGG